MVRGESSTPGGRSGRARRTLDAMSTPSATRDEIDRFATAIGEWLLTQEFGVIKPLAFRHRLGLSRQGDDLEPYVIIELLVTDPPPPPPREVLERMSLRERGAALSWPIEDWMAVFEAAQAKGREMGLPPDILATYPVDVRMFGESEMDEDEFPR